MGNRCPTQVQGWAFKMKLTPTLKYLLNWEGENRNKEREKMNVKVVLNFIKHHAMRSFVGGGLAPRILSPNTPWR
jgi:hypothetical protein